MKFYDFKEDEKRIDVYNERWYKHPTNGKFYRNVTTILGIISKGYNYEEWLKNNGHNAEIIVDRAGTFGSAFHEVVEKFLLGNTVTYFDYKYLGDRPSTALWERFALWYDWWVELNTKYKVEYKPEGVEHIVYNDDYEYAGTVDFIARIDGEPQIFDWKTSNYIQESYKQQMVAYMNPLGIKKANLVHFPAQKPNKKGYRVHEVEYSDERFDLFVATKKLFDSENKDQPKVLELPISYSLNEEEDA